MIDSVLKVPAATLKEIQDKMSTNTRQQRRVKRHFFLKTEDSEP
jgi:hypothetical protein